jgi:hypothetical protein
MHTNFNSDLSRVTDCPQLFVIAATIVAVSAASPVSYNIVPLRRGVLSPTVTYTSSPTYAYTIPIGKYSDALETYSSTAVRPVVSPTVYAAKTSLVAQGAVESEYDPNPQYRYSYSVNAPETGDSKSHEESRNGDSVQGSYSVVESDGSIRRVDYTADAVTGFNAVVQREVGAVAPPPAPVKPLPAAPVVTRIAAPASTVAYKPAPTLAVKSIPQVTYQSVPQLTFQSVPAATIKTAPALAFKSIPQATYQPIPELTFQSVPAATVKTAPALALKPIPQVTYQSVPEVTYKSVPAATYKSTPALAVHSVPEVTYQSVPDVLAVNPVPAVQYQSVPAVRVAVPAAQQVSLAQLGSARTSFSAPYANYEY